MPEPDSKIKSRAPSLFGLAPCVVCPARCIATAAVRSYRTFSPLPSSVKTRAVCFLWHFPSNGLESALPDVIRHTALRSSDFPLPASEDAGSDRPVQLPTESLYPGIRLSASGSRRPAIGVRPSLQRCRSTWYLLADRLIPRKNSVFRETGSRTHAHSRSHPHRAAVALGE